MIAELAHPLAFWGPIVVLAAALFAFGLADVVQHFNDPNTYSGFWGAVILSLYGLVLLCLGLAAWISWSINGDFKGMF